MLQKSLQKLSNSEKILLAEDLWDSVAEDGISVGVEERNFIRERIKDLNARRYRSRSWEKIKAKIGLKK